MTISSAIKRLQMMEDKHGGEMEFGSIQTEPGGVYTDTENLVIDVVTHKGKTFCALMPQSHWEDNAPRGIRYKQE